MPVSSLRLLPRIALSVALAASACSSPEPALLTCEAAADCPMGTRCIARGCVANSPPHPVVALPPGELQANALHAFDGSSSADPDEGDVVASFAWVFRSVDAPCDPPLVAGTGPVAMVRFACPGRYRLDLLAVDSMGAVGKESVELAVVPYAGPTLVVAAADVVVDHACTLAPLRCAPAQPVVLGATAPGVAPGEVSFAWAVEEPADRPLDGTRRVTFQPGPDVAAPSVVVETDGTSISGDWVFRVAARDAAGVLGSAAMRVSIGNRPPVIEGVPPGPVNHLFLGDRFVATGEVAVTVTDPDGDPLVQRSAQWRHAGDGPGAVFEGVDELSALTFSVAVPYAGPEDAFHLIGGVGLERSIELAVSDANGARTTATWAIEVANRPPVPASTPAPFTVQHTYDPGRLAYVATAPLSTWTDPDGDPLFPVPGASTGDAQCALVVSGAAARAECSLAFVGTPSVANFAGAHVVTQHVQDPWVAAAPATATFTIGNRAPSITSTATHVVGGVCFDWGGCCQGPANECLQYWATSASGASTVPSRWADPDGDPLQIQVAAAGAVTPFQPLVCVPAGCDLALQLSEERVCGARTTSHATTVTDGLDSATGALAVERQCY